MKLKLIGFNYREDIGRSMQCIDLNSISSISNITCDLCIEDATNPDNNKKPIYYFRIYYKNNQESFVQINNTLNNIKEIHSRAIKAFTRPFLFKVIDIIRGIY